MRKLCLILALSHLSFSFLNAQNSDAITADASLKRVISLFNEKKYTEAINEAHHGISLCKVNDTNTHARLLSYEALCNNWLHQNDKALHLLEKAFSIHNKEDQTFTFLCYLYSRIGTITKEGKENLLTVSITHLLNTTDYLEEGLTNLETYLNSKYKFKYYRDDSTLSAYLQEERQKFSKCTNPIIDTFFEFMYAELLSNYQCTPQIIARYKASFHEFSKTDTEKSKEIQYKCLYALARAYSILGYYGAASFYREKALDILYIHWKKWKHTSPWSYSPNSANGPMAHFRDHIEDLENCGLYQMAVDYCDNVIKDKWLKNMDKSCSEYVYSERQNALNILSDKYLHADQPPVEETESRANGQSIINIFESGKLTEDIIKRLTINERDTLCRHLLNIQNYTDLIRICNSILSDFNSIYEEEDDMMYNLSRKDIKSNKCTRYEFEIDRERGCWHYSLGLSSIWKSYYYLAQTYLAMHDFENAINFQKRVVDNVRTDWKFHPDLRSDLLQSYSDSKRSSIFYIDTEVQMLMNLAYIYLCSAQYDKAYTTYRTALDLNLQVLKSALNKGNRYSKEQEWESRNHIYYQILSDLRDKADDFPQFSKLVLECSLLTKNFILNHNIHRQNTIKESGEDIKFSYTKLMKAERASERYNYFRQGDILSILKERDEADYHISSVINMGSDVDNSIVSFQEISSQLESNDVFIDFFSVYANNSIEKVHEVQWLRESSSPLSIALSQRVLYNDFYLYASIVRNDWDVPAIVYIGKTSDLKFNEEQDIFDYLYVKEKTPERVAELISNKSLSDFVWKRLISVGKITEGENIYFIPDNIFNDLPIEHLTLRSDITVSDLYDIVRLSSAQDIKAIHTNRYDANDKCIAFGDISYTTDFNPPANLPEYCYCETMLDRKGLNRLSGTRKVLRTIKDNINNSVIYSGTEATEEEFYRLDANSPEILFFGTHGYYFYLYELSEEEKEYLYGKHRTIAMTDERKEMYASGLYMAQSYTQNVTTDGMLTANEVSLQDLSNTKLVILSACSSALGNQNKDGKSGLIRGFKMAGAQNILATLWDVDEQATQLLMTEFFKHYTKGDNAHTALKKAQKYVRNYRNDDIFNPIMYENPYFWAGFILN